MPPRSHHKGATTVRRLCERLGYASQDRASNRYWANLSNPARKAFLHFLQQSDDSLEDGLNYKQTEQCSTEFCDSIDGQRLFEDSAEAKENKWPCMPEDRDSIIEVVAELVTLQHNRRATGGKDGAGPKAKKPKTGKAQKLSPKRTHESIIESSPEPEFSSATTSDGSHIEDDYTRNFGPSTSDSRELERQEMDRLAKVRRDQERVQYNIEQHLQLIYPEDGPEASEYVACDIREYSKLDLENHPDLGWLFRLATNTHWSLSDKIIMWRFMHKHACYSQAPGIEMLEPAVKHLLKYLKVESNAEQRVMVCEKVKRFVVASTRRWEKEYGLLERDKKTGIFSRVEAFDTALRAEMVAWDSLEEDLDSDIPANPKDNESDRHQNKRRKMPVAKERLLNPPRSLSPDSDSLSDDDWEGHSQNESSGAVNGGYQPQIEEAARPVDSRDSEAPYLEFHSEDFDSSPIAPNRRESSLPSDITSRYKESDSSPTRLYSVSSLKTSPVEKDDKVSNTRMSMSSSLRTTRTGPAASRSLATNPAKPILIFQSSTGAWDFENPIPSSLLKTSTLEQFFTHYAQRSGIHIDNLSTLIFDIVFANSENLVIKTWSSEEEWRTLKMRIAKLLERTKASKPKMNHFEIWVQPEEPPVTENVEDDDDLDGL